MTDALDRGRENATEIVSSFVTGTWILALIAGFDWWLWFMLFGYVVLVPTVSRLFGGEWEDEERRRAGDRREASDEAWRGHPDAWRGDAHDGDESGANSRPEQTDGDALATLRDRYARGELTDEQFERKVERLLETETLEDVEDRARRSSNAEVDDRRETNR